MSEQPLPWPSPRPAGSAVGGVEAAAGTLPHLMRPGTLTLEALPPLSLYVHLPWCLKKCPYCDFNSHEWGARAGTGDALPQQRYLDALRVDLESSLPLIWGRRVHSIFIGGGTPSLFEPAAIDRLLADIRARVPPRARLRDHARGQSRHLRARSIPRLSGCRREPAVDRRAELRRRQAARARPRSRRRPGARRAERGRGLLRDLEPRPDVRAARADARPVRRRPASRRSTLQPPHLSIYHLTLEPNTLFASRPPAGADALPDDDLAFEMLDLISERTARARTRALRGLGVCTQRPSLRPQPQLLAVRRLPRHRRRRARQAELCAPGDPAGALPRPARLHGAGRGRHAGRAAARGRARRPAVRVHAERAAAEGRFSTRRFQPPHRTAADRDRRAARCGRARRVCWNAISSAPGRPRAASTG